MNEQATTAPIATTPSRKQVRQEIVNKLTGALAEYKQDLGEKKLATHVKKVSKLISRDLLKISKKKKPTKKTTPKKTSSKKASPKAEKK
jgi:hypothetical protein